MQTDPVTLTANRRHHAVRTTRASSAGSHGWLSADLTARQLAQRIRGENLSDSDAADLLYVWVESRKNKIVGETHAADAFGRELLLDLDYHTVIGKVLQRTRDLSGGDAVALCLSDDARIQHGPAMTYRATDDVSGEPFTASKVASVEISDRGDLAPHRKICAGCPLQRDGSTCTSIPLRVGANAPLGALCVADDRRANRQTVQQLRDLAAFANWAAIALTNATRLADAECKARAVRAQMVAHLHDNAAQTISLLAFKVDQLADRIEREELAAAADQVGVIRSIVHKIGAQVREVLSDNVEPARPEQDFLPEMRACADAFSQFAAIPVEFLVFDECYPKAAAQAQALHIVGEALANVRRHAQAHTVRIEIKRTAGDVQIEVRDDGKGFAKEVAGGPHHLGMTIMKERARRCGGQLFVESAPGQGTCVRLRLPLAA